jgi:hypothetical protein
VWDVFGRIVFVVFVYGVSNFINYLIYSIDKYILYFLQIALLYWYVRYCGDV